ncbi:MAG: outer membrane beta-barrel protein [Melioribacteraceae bacterium]|nr:outer membrane beta-barrel protein [Melioribacteraceae bacterium]
MKKIFPALMFLFFVSITTNAQKISLSAGPIVALPMGDFGDIAGTGFGGSVRGEYPLNEKLVAIAELGYITWGEKEDLGFKYSYSNIPVLVGAKYFFTKNVYGIAQTGLNLFSWEFEADLGWLGKVSESESSSEFGIGAGAGYEFKVGNLVLDVNAIYQLISDLNYLGIRAGVKFKL